MGFFMIKVRAMTSIVEIILVVVGIIISLLPAGGLVMA